MVGSLPVNLHSGGVCDLDGREIIAPDKYLFVFPPFNGYFKVYNNNKEGACDINGREIIAPDKYTSVSFHKTEGHIGYFEVKISDKEGACDIDGKEIIAPMFETLIYMEKDGFKYKDSQGYHPLGITLDETRYSRNTKPSYVNTAQSSNDNDGQSTASRIAKGLSIFAEALQAYGEAMNGGQQPAATVGGSGSDNVPSGKSCSFYQDQYRREENFVKTMYSGMTSGGGYSKKDSQGNDREGKTSGDWGSANHSTNMKNLRAGQQRMRKIRQEAQRNGCSIPQSNYETVTVSY